jgi:hypothetical protein
MKNNYMNKFARTLNFAFVLSMLVVCFALTSNAQTVPNEVKEIAGTFTGAWTAFTLNAGGEVVKQRAWTDAMKAENPIAEKDRAYVSTIDEMTFEGGRIPPQKIPGKEGYLLNKDGSLGEYFMEIFGQTITMKKLSKDTWVYTTAAAPREFMMLGDKFLSATHVLVKTVTFEQGIETHNISRVTTVLWKDAAGKDRSTQFVSLQGQHKRAAK